MKFRKTVSILVVLALAIFAGVGASQAGMWVGPYGGVSFGTSQDIKVNAPFVSNTIYNAKFRTGFTTGLSVGYDFTDPKLFPDWARYFGVQMDVGYTQTNFSAQSRTTDFGKSFSFANVDGGNTALTFMLVGRAPLMATKDYPNGQLQPYLGVGPTVQFASYDFNNYGGGSTTNTNVGLTTEAGIRYMVTPNFSAGLAYRYSYMPGSADVNLPGVGNANFSGTKNTSQALFRVAYHF
jgi:opacity protein-like surface antigen